MRQRQPNIISPTGISNKFITERVPRRHSTLSAGKSKTTAKRLSRPATTRSITSPGPPIQPLFTLRSSAPCKTTASKSLRRGAGTTACTKSYISSVATSTRTACSPHFPMIHSYRQGAHPRSNDSIKREFLIRPNTYRKIFLNFRTWQRKRKYS